MAMTFQLWRFVAVKDEHRSTWELVGEFPNVRRARQRLHELAGSNVVSPEDDTFWFEDEEGTQRFRIEAVMAQPQSPEPRASSPEQHGQ